jgi:uncharacterized protein (DUF1778 family)
MEPRTETNQKATRLNIRASARQKALIAKAARLKEKTISDFVLENAYQAAQEVIAQQKLADQTHFVLPKAEWEAFCAALDAPPKSKPALRKMLTEPGLFDEQR